MLGALYALILANTVQIAAGMAQLEVSPPQEVLPLLAATVALGVAAVPLVRAGQRSGLLLGIGFCALSLIGMGPHKLFLDDGIVIAPMALTGFAFEIVFVWAGHPGAPRSVMRFSQAVLVAAVVLTGLSAGFFYTYEASVTLGLAQVDDTTYVTTFQALNDTIRNPGFGIAFFGALPAIIAALALNWTSGTIRRWTISAGLGLYLLCLATTAVGNVPLNEELAEVTTVTPATATDARSEFEDDWNRLNLTRTIAVVASFVSLAMAAGPQRSCSAPTGRPAGAARSVRLGLVRVFAARSAHAGLQLRPRRLVSVDESSDRGGVRAPARVAPLRTERTVQNLDNPSDLTLQVLAISAGMGVAIGGAS